MINIEQTPYEPQPQEGGEGASSGRGAGGRGRIPLVATGGLDSSESQSSFREPTAMTEGQLYKFCLLWTFDGSQESIRRNVSARAITTLLDFTRGVISDNVAEVLSFRLRGFLEDSLLSPHAYKVLEKVGKYSWKSDIAPDLNISLEDLKIDRGVITKVESPNVETYKLSDNPYGIFVAGSHVRGVENTLLAYHSRMMRVGAFGFHNDSEESIFHQNWEKMLQDS